MTEASAKSYRSMKAMGQDPFHFNQTTGTSQFLANAFTAGEGNLDLSEYAGRFPGSWTLPVCDASTWGVHYAQILYNSILHTSFDPVVTKMEKHTDFEFLS